MSRVLSPGAPLIALLALAVVLPTSDAAAQQPVLAGLDFLETNTELSFEDLSELGALCPGCQVVGNPRIQLRGIPIEETPECPTTESLGNVDTIVRRLQDTPPLFPGQPAEVPIEIVELHLQSVQPFQVDCGGQIQNWMLDIQVDPTQQPVGQMIIVRQNENGGFFDSILPVVPLLTFTRVDDCPAAVVCQVQGPLIQFQTDQAPWVHHAPFAVLEIPGCTSNFVAGVDPFGDATGGGFSEVALLRRHGVLPPPPPKLTQHTWQEAIHFTFWTTNHGGKSGAGTFDAMRFFSPTFIPPGPPGAPPNPDVYFKSNSICNLDSLWTPCPTSWCRVNWDDTDPLFRREAWWFFPRVPVGEMAPEMDVVFSVPVIPPCEPDPAGAWYEVKYECYLQCAVVDTGTFRFHCDLPGGPGGIQNDGPQEIRLDLNNLLKQNYPNPFNPRTTIRYAVPADANVTLRIYNVQGEVVRVLEDGPKAAGNYEAEWDGRDGSGRPVSSGSYFYEIQVGERRESRKMIILK